MKSKEKQSINNCPNYLFGAKVYLIGNLEFEKDSAAKSWRQEFKDLTKELKLTCLDPLERTLLNFPPEPESFRQNLKKLLKNGDYNSVHEEMKLVRRKDLSLVDISNFIVGVLNPKIPSFGVVEELSWATRTNKPIFLVMRGKREKTPLWIAGMLKKECIYNSIKDVVSELKRLNCGKKPLDNKYWRILLEELR